MPDNGTRRTCSRSGPGRHRGERTRTVMPENGTARACSRLGPTRPSPYVAPRLASRPIAVLPIPSRSPTLMDHIRSRGDSFLSTCGGAWRSETVMPDNGTRRTCSRSGPARLATYVDLRLASRPIAVPRIASRSPPYTSTYGAVRTALLSTCEGRDCVPVYMWRGVAECDVGTQRRSE
jgi:hypothetical protein